MMQARSGWSTCAPWPRRARPSPSEGISPMICHKGRQMRSIGDPALPRIRLTLRDGEPVADKQRHHAGAQQHEDRSCRPRSPTSMPVRAKPAIGCATCSQPLWRCLSSHSRSSQEPYCRDQSTMVESTFDGHGAVVWRKALRTLDAIGRPHCAPGTVLPGLERVRSRLSDLVRAVAPVTTSLRKVRHAPAPGRRHASPAAVRVSGWRGRA
jgi:hypothetical protein